MLVAQVLILSVPVRALLVGPLIGSLSVLLTLLATICYRRIVFCVNCVLDFIVVRSASWLRLYKPVLSLGALLRARIGCMKLHGIMLAEINLLVLAS